MSTSDSERHETFFPANPYFELICLAERVAAEEGDRIPRGPQQRRPSGRVWGERVEAVERELSRARDAALQCADQTGFGVQEVESRINNLTGYINAFLRWPLDAPKLPPHLIETNQMNGIWEEPASEYLIGLLLRMQSTALEPVKVLGVRMEGSQRQTGAYQQPTRTDSPSRYNPHERQPRTLGELHCWALADAAFRRATLLPWPKELHEPPIPGLERLLDYVRSEFGLGLTVESVERLTSRYALLTGASRADSQQTTIEVAAQVLAPIPQTRPHSERSRDQPPIDSANGIGTVSANAPPRQDQTGDAGNRRAQEANECVNRFELRGSTWVVQFGKENGLLANNLKGLNCIARLLQQKHASILACQVEGDARPETLGEQNQADTDAIDEQTKAELRDRLIELNKDIQEAEQREDDKTYNKHIQERDKLTAYLKQSTGKFGKSRKLTKGNSAEGAAERVKKAFPPVYLMLKNEAKMPNLASHLKKSIKKEGRSFAYRPNTDIDWLISF